MHDLSAIEINNKNYSPVAAARVISQTFNVQLGSASAKPANNPSQISDPFHIWSRQVFDRTVIKTDVDLLTLDSNLSRVKSIVEVKRSQKSRVGTWCPYVNPHDNNQDINNYLLEMTLCNLIGADLVTVHHDNMVNASTLNSNDQVDIFVYKSSTVQPSQGILNAFAAPNNRMTVTAQSLLQYV